MNSFNLNEDQQDCLQEIINVAMGQASDQLARYLDTFVYLRVPSIEQVDSESLTNTLFSDECAVAVVSQGFFGYEGIRGEALLMYQPEDSDKLAFDHVSFLPPRAPFPKNASLRVRITRCRK